MLSDNAFDVIADVRSKAEWDTGRIKGATLVEALEQFPNLDIPKGSPDDLMGCEFCRIAVYCRSGARARGAIQVLLDNGFRGRLYNGLGVSQWTRAGYPLTTTDDSVVPPCTVDMSASDSCYDTFVEEEGAIYEDMVQAQWDTWSDQMESITATMKNEIDNIEP